MPLACPEAPEAYEGSDEIVAELRALRAESARSCEALSTRLVVLAERLWFSVAEQAQARPGREKAQEVLSELLPPLEATAQSPQEVKLIAPLPVPVEDAAAEQYGREIASATGRPLEVESTGPVSVTDPETHAKLAAATEASDEKSELLLQAIFVVVGTMLGLFILGLLKAVLDRAN
ncbi:MAG: hypothetical protein WAN65_10160 [Candidatus Sulfotelmatobacter sp.]